MYLSYMTLHCTKISIINQTLTECRIKVFQTKLSCIPDDNPTFLSKNRGSQQQILGFRFGVHPSKNMFYNINSRNIITIIFRLI